MKSILIVILLGLSFPQTTKLNGKYYVVFQNENFQKNDYIDFNQTTFTMKRSDLLPYSGNVNYGKTLTSIESKLYPNIIIDFRTDEVGKDTIHFQVHSKNSEAMNYLDVSINSGKFIKVK